jgi:hypothetical protein
MDALGHSGLYYFMGMALEVRPGGDQLLAAVPGVPPGFEIVLEASGDDRFRMRGGPLDGSTVTFLRDADGAVRGVRAGDFEMAKVAPEDAGSLEITERLLAPEMALSPAKRARFEELLGSILERSDGGWIDYDLSAAKHEFVQYVTAQDAVIFHGSNNTGIATFEPVRKSFELMDESGRGNLQAVYGTHDGLWSMFFAVVDRERLKGSIRNGVMYFHNQSGEQLSVYHFSINREQLDERPYTQGALYFLPRETFFRLKLTEEAYANEWASEHPVRPYAKLSVEPEDFPFLDQIGGHDDSDLARLGEISEALRAAATAARLEGDRFEVRLPRDADVLGQLDEYAALQKVMVPSVKLEVQEAPDGVSLVLTALPPALGQVMRDSYAELLDEGQAA